MSEGKHLFQMSQEELDAENAEIEREIDSKINEHATKYAILNIAKTPEEALLMVEYLTSIDWQQEFIARQASEQYALRTKMELHNRALQNGAGICVWCNNFQDKLYNWPHNVYPHPWGRWDVSDKNRASIAKYCWKCFREVQDQIEYHLREEWTKRGMEDSHGNILIWEDKLDRCSLCERLIPVKAIFSFRFEKYRTLWVCLHCIERAVESQFKYCKDCGKKSTNGLIGFVCHDCYIESPYQPQVSSHLARARSAGTPATLTLKEWISTLEHFNYKCAYCRHRPFQVLEHFLPISLGGGTTADNCVPACASCNQKKSDRHPDTLCYQNTLFGPTLLSPQQTDFILEHIEYIRQYLRSEKPLFKPLPKNDRSLIVYKGIEL